MRDMSESRAEEIRAGHINPAEIITKLRNGPGKWGEALESLGTGLNLHAKYLASDRENFGEIRENLNKRPGILIANHPSPFDLCLIMPALRRSDTLLMLQQKNFAFLKNVLGEQYVVPATSDRSELIEITGKIVRHIASGGLFIILPSAGEELKTNELHFKSGFRHIVSRIDPSNMVYVFDIDPTIGQTLTSQILGAPNGPEDKPLQIAPGVHVRPLKDPLEIKVNEYCTDASEWQSIISAARGSSGAAQNELLTKHFLEKSAF